MKSPEVRPVRFLIEVNVPFRGARWPSHAPVALSDLRHIHNFRKWASDREVASNNPYYSMELRQVLPTEGGPARGAVLLKTRHEMNIGLFYIFPP